MKLVEITKCLHKNPSQPSFNGEKIYAKNLKTSRYAKANNKRG